MSGKTVDFHEKQLDLFYIPRKQNLKVNYLLEDGTVLSKQDVPAFYHETYGTSASDIDDMYALVTEKLPKNAAGYLKSENETINYYYRKTKGYWVELNYGAQAITRLDYRGNIRSNGINYNDGEVITLINGENKSLLVHHDTVSKGAMSQQKLAPGKSVNVTLLNGDTVTVSLGTDGKAKVVRQSTSYQMTSEIQQGNWVNSTAIYDWQKTLVEEQITKVNGVSGQILSRFTKQYTNGLVATSNVVTNGNVKPNTTAKDVAGTTFKRSVKMAPKTAAQPEVALAKMSDVLSNTAKTDEDSTQNDESEDIVEPVDDHGEAEAVEPKVSFEDTLVSAPVNKATTFDASAAGDIVDDKKAMQGLTNQHQVSVYDGDKLLKSGTVPTGEKLMVEKADPEAASDDTPSDAKKLPEQSTGGLLEVNPEADGNMTTREPGDPTGKTSGQLPGTGSDITFWVTAMGLLVLVLTLVGFFIIRGGKKHV